MSIYWKSVNLFRLSERARKWSMFPSVTMDKFPYRMMLWKHNNIIFNLKSEGSYDNFYKWNFYYPFISLLFLSCNFRLTSLCLRRKYQVISLSWCSQWILGQILINGLLTLNFSFILFVSTAPNHVSPLRSKKKKKG